MSSRSGRHPGKKCLLITLAVILVIVAALAWFGIAKTVRTFTAMQSTLPDELAKIREMPLVDKIEGAVRRMEKLGRHAKRYAGDALAVRERDRALRPLHHDGVHVLAVVYVHAGRGRAVVDHRHAPVAWHVMGRPSSRCSSDHRHACNTLMTLPVHIPFHPVPLICVFVTTLSCRHRQLLSRHTTLALPRVPAEGWLGVGIFPGCVVRVGLWPPHGAA